MSSSVAVSYLSTPCFSPSQRIGRWLSRDPIGYEGGINLYGYVEDRPINKKDPLGLISCECKAALQELGAALSDAANQLAKYNADTDAQGGIPIYRGGKPIGKVTKPGGHAEKLTNALRRLEKAINNVMDKCKDDLPPAATVAESLLEAIEAVE